MTQTAIPTTGYITCPSCDAECEAEITNRTLYHKCGCGKLLYKRQPPTLIMDILGLFGYGVSIDWDGALLIESEAELPDNLRAWLFEHQGELRSSIEFKGRVARAIYLGGTKDGERHHYYHYHLNPFVYVHIARAHWETYKMKQRNDPRLFYVGRSTSKAKAKRGEYVVTAGVDNESE